MALRGVGSSSGVGFGHSAHVVLTEELSDGTDAEMAEDLLTVFERARASLEHAASRAQGEVADILRGQLAMLSDPTFRKEMQAKLGSAEVRAESEALASAIEEGARTFRERLASSSMSRIQQRVSDVDDLSARLVAEVSGRSFSDVMPEGEGPFVLVATDLLPSQTARIDPKRVAGIVLEGGGPTAHAAIIARALGIPLVTGAAGARQQLRESAEVLVDGASGEVWIHPRAATRELVLARIPADNPAAAVGIRSVELVGGKVSLAVNIGAVSEAVRAADVGARAAGLVRSELLAFAGLRGRNSITDAVRKIGAALGGPIVFRLLDVGGDKPLDGVTQSGEPNPMLGARGIRLLERSRPEFVEQLAGLAAAMDDVELLISVPMVVEPAEVTQVRRLWAETSDRPPPPIGIMVETPSAVLLADELAEVSDFFSIGTNDLTQYLLAADRGNPHVADLIDPAHPAVLRAVRLVVEAAEGAGIPVAVCGQAAADPRVQRLLLGLGVNELSVPREDFQATATALEGLAIEELRAEAAAALRSGTPGSRSAAGTVGASRPTAAPMSQDSDHNRFVVTNSEGLHVRPASQLADVAAKHGVKITVRTVAGDADASSVFSLLALGIDTGAEVEIEVFGDASETAWPEILAIIRGEAA